jgi:hypothetical protein
MVSPLLLIIEKFSPEGFDWIDTSRLGRLTMEAQLESRIELATALATRILEMEDIR